MARAETEQPDPNRYPPFVTTDDEKRRWDLCLKTAVEALGEPEHRAVVWQANPLALHQRHPNRLSAAVVARRSQALTASRFDVG